MCRHPSYRPGLTVRTALPSCVVSGWTLAMDGGCLAHATCYLLFLLFLHPSCGSLKAQTDCVLRPIVITLEPTKHLNRRTKYSSQCARTPEVQSWFLSPLLGEEGEPRLWLEFWDRTCNRCSQTNNITNGASGVQDYEHIITIYLRDSYDNWRDSTMENRKLLHFHRRLLSWINFLITLRITKNCQCKGRELEKARFMEKKKPEKQDPHFIGTDHL